jgi:hypothetical protein
VKEIEIFSISREINSFSFVPFESPEWISALTDLLSESYRAVTGQFQSLQFLRERLSATARQLQAASRARRCSRGKQSRVPERRTESPLRHEGEAPPPETSTEAAEVRELHAH